MQSCTRVFAPVRKEQPMTPNECMDWTTDSRARFASAPLRLCHGEASLGGVQQQFALLDEDGNSVFSPGALEVAAYECFHTEKTDDA